ncbi:MAG: condensation domain-containing protein, partial [Chloroflexota bacterium]
LGGVGLARGYFGQPELTAARFVPNPFGAVGGERLYRTGDLCRCLPDGNIVYLGRLDHQVKLRGFRIELGEIEVALGQHPIVREAAVLAREDRPGHRQLVAYLVCGAAQPDIAELRAWLKAQLPEYMLPSAYIFMEMLPLTPNGKLDRKALPAPDGERPGLAEAYVAPHTPEEQTLAEIWMQVLGLAQVGIHDNFFALGGDSLLGIQAITYANQAGLKLLPRQIFQYQTIAELAAAGETVAAEAEQGAIVGDMPLTPSQARFFRHDYPQPQWWNVSKLFKLERDLADVALWEQAVQQVIVHHDALRARFVHEASGWRQIVHASGAEQAVVTRVDLAALPIRTREMGMLAQATQIQQSLNLAEGPLLRVVLFDLGAAKPCYLLVTVHHLVADGVALWVLMEDLVAACQQLRRGDAVTFAPKTTSVRQWAENLHAYAATPQFQEQLDAWLALPWDQAGPLPVDRPENRAQNTFGSRDLEAALLSAEETEALFKVIPLRCQVQPHEVLLTALAQSVARWTGRPWVAIDTVDAGRVLDIPGTEKMDLSRTVGWLSTHHLLLLHSREGESPAEALESIRNQLRRFPRPGIPADIARLSPAYPAQKGFPGWASDLRWNYAGRGGQPANTVLQPASLPPGATLNPDGCESYLLGCIVSAPGRRLVCTWDYSRNLYDKATVKRLVEDFKDTLKGLIASTSTVSQHS